jgi:hypothetical protein
LNIDIKANNNDGQVIKLTGFPLKPETAKNILKYDVFFHQCCNVTMVFLLEMPMCFKDIKPVMLTWLKKQNCMMTRHDFDMKILNIVKISFMDTCQESLHQEINTNMHRLMRKMTNAQQESIQATHICSLAICQTTVPEVRAQYIQPVGCTEA